MLRFAVVLFAFVYQANAGCLFPPPPCPIPGASAKVLQAAALRAPAILPCPPVATQVQQHPDVNIPLPLPSEIPIGRFCSCQKYGITPSLVPCAPAPEPVAAPAPAPIVVSAPAPAPIVVPAPAPCAAAAPLVLPAPAPCAAAAPLVLSAPAPVVLPAPAPSPLANPALLNTLLGLLPAAKPDCGCA
ncbi:hypothetical protein ABEB36_008490 [Hypothenemus hampei]|uniref:Uncharacterized protein n=1 Tax=Hypothenemus hampei TaxID=57062 RepID=A0ABD1EM29_HYPHA